VDLVARGDYVQKTSNLRQKEAEEWKTKFEDLARRPAAVPGAKSRNSLARIQQKSAGPYSPNISTIGPNSPVTLGPNSPVTINPRAPDRVVSDEKQHEMGRILGEAPGNRVVLVLIGDAENPIESNQLGSRLHDAFVEGHWQVQNHAVGQLTITQSPPLSYNLSVGLHAAAASGSDELLALVKRAFSKAALDIQIHENSYGIVQLFDLPRRRPNGQLPRFGPQVAIVVGRKPQ
jgi:hypothetical protein